jgi:antirestriction protein ArdC
LPADIAGIAPPPPVLTPDTAKAFTLDENLLAWRASTGANIQHGQDRAFYRPKSDMIGMPDHDKFDAECSYWATLFHEIGHWTGADKRLKRGMDDKFGDSGYAFEELVAELTSAFLCAKHGVVGEQRHAGYIESWLKELKNDKKYIVKAASAAMKAVDYLEQNTVTVSEKICEAA